MTQYPLRARRRRATSRFRLQVTLLVLAIIGIAYSAWFARWVRPVRHISVQVTR